MAKRDDGTTFFDDGRGRISAGTGTITRDDLLSALRSLHESGDAEAAHIEADNLVLAFIGDDEIAAAFWAITRWYA